MLEKFQFPTAFLIVGSVCTLVGALLSSSEQNKFQEKITTKSEEIAKKSDEIANKNEEISKKNEEIAKLNHQIVGLVTGGDSFCYIIALKNSSHEYISTMLIHQGNFPLYDLNARIVDLDEMKSQKTFTIQNSFGHVLNVGNLPAQTSQLSFNIVPNQKDKLRYNIFFNGRNGFFSQLLRLQYIKGEWKSAIRVLGGANGGKVLFEQIDPDLKGIDFEKF